jgi:hypothetical protein
VNVARSHEEAETQARTGRAVGRTDEDEREAAAAAREREAEALFEEPSMEEEAGDFAAGRETGEPDVEEEEPAAKTDASTPSG